MDHQLAAALESGSFAHGLRTAIRMRGLTLEQVQHELADRGVVVSSVTLSYWSRGRSQPERAESIKAVKLLEGILDTPTGSLTALLAPPRPRGPRRAHVAVSIDRQRLWDEAHRLDRVMAQLGSQDEERLCLLSVHDRFQLDERRRPTRLTITEVLRAQRDRVDRALVIFQGRELGRTPKLTVVRGGWPGRVRTDEGAGFLVAEVMLDRVIDSGETAVIECALNYGSHAEPMTDYDRRLPYAARGYLLEIEFHQTAMPVRCHATTRPTIEHVRRDVHELSLGGAPHAHLALFDVAPGIHGLRWEWE
ncbi:hypothetical protein [Kutzneria chonburiensis]|uniref:XRE family transcriptional regulator n=1 Tax=Kutzneria chonburiensis TaxID=1483604 RepID=A0ABV6MMS4_9PSEU|nr:hypothetical protein [Kutzneria chonburiensis]